MKTISYFLFLSFLISISCSAPYRTELDICTGYGAGFIYENTHVYNFALYPECTGC